MLVLDSTVGFNTNFCEENTHYENLKDEHKLSSSIIDFFKTSKKVGQFLVEPTSALKSKTLTQEEIEKVHNLILQGKIYSSDVPEIQELKKKIWRGYFVKFAFEKFYSENPSFDITIYKNYYDKFHYYAIEGLRECMYEFVGLKNIATYSKAFFEVNLKKSWKSEISWINGAYDKGFFVNAKEEVTRDKRTGLKIITTLFIDYMSKLGDKFPEVNNKITIHRHEIGNLATAETQRIYNLAYDKMLEMDSMKASVYSLNQMMKEGL